MKGLTAGHNKVFEEKCFKSWLEIAELEGDYKRSEAEIKRHRAMMSIKCPRQSRYRSSTD